MHLTININQLRISHNTNEDYIDLENKLQHLQNLEIITKYILHTMGDLDCLHHVLPKEKHK